MIQIARATSDGEGILHQLDDGNYSYTVPYNSAYVDLLVGATDEVDQNLPAVTVSGG